MPTEEGSQRSRRQPHAYAHSHATTNVTRQLLFHTLSHVKQQQKERLTTHAAAAHVREREMHALRGGAAASFVRTCAGCRQACALTRSSASSTWPAQLMSSGQAGAGELASGRASEHARASPARGPATRRAAGRVSECRQREQLQREHMGLAHPPPTRGHGNAHAWPTWPAATQPACPSLPRPAPKPVRRMSVCECSLKQPVTATAAKRTVVRVATAAGRRSRRSGVAAASAPPADTMSRRRASAN